MNESPISLDSTSVLISTVLAVLESNSELAAVGVFTSRAGDSDAPPYVLQAALSDDAVDHLQSEAYRRLTLSVVVVAEDADGQDWMSQAVPLKARFHYALNGKTRDDRERVLAALNALAQPDGWKITRCAELTGIPPYRSSISGIGSIERWRMGHIYEIKMQRV